MLRELVTELLYNGRRRRTQGHVSCQLTSFNALMAGCKHACSSASLFTKVSADNARGSRHIRSMSAASSPSYSALLQAAVSHVQYVHGRQCVWYLRVTRLMLVMGVPQGL
eukprot:GHRQ01028818.1.p1 GENE.GHRQ01028818.1~~GHRQ01028818.1.p1  ORF type:complete len:110 (-),score=20.39 GHRQ01028818.1:267-596(-)